VTRDLTPQSNRLLDEGAPWDDGTVRNRTLRPMNAKMVAITCSEMEAASGTTQRELDEMKQEILKARCVATATDDPRLQEKERTRNPSQPALRRKRRTLPVFIIAGGDANSSVSCPFRKSV
jgi:hypothetical protein